MSKIFYLFFWTFFLLIPCIIKAQDNISDSKKVIPGFTGHFSWELPGGNMAERYGSNGNVGGGFFLKTKSNFIFMAEGSYLFGQKIKYDSLFHLIKTHDNYIIDGDGMYADVRTYERGFSVFGKVGKIIPVFNDNPNSGLTLIAGGGFLQHKIRIENPGNTVPQLNETYRKGYDKLTNGPALSEFIGYTHFSDNRLYNFRAGFEFTQAFTQSRRNYDYDLMGKDTQKRIDLFFGIKACWMFPLNKRTPREFYYN